MKTPIILLSEENIRLGLRVKEVKPVAFPVNSTLEIIDLDFEKKSFTVKIVTPKHWKTPFIEYFHKLNEFRLVKSSANLKKVTARAVA